MNYRDQSFRGSALAGDDLRGVDFSGCTFIDIEWSGRDLTDAVFADARFEGGSIAGACLEATDLTRTRFRETNARGASFVDAVFTGTQLTDVDLTDAKLTGAWMSGAIILGGWLTRADFSNAILRTCGFNFVRGEAANFTGCEITSPNDAGQGTVEIALPAANFARAVLRDVTWQGARLPWTKFVGAKLNRVVLAGAELDHTDFTDADLESVILDGAALSNAEFGGSEPKPAPREPALVFVPEPLPALRLRHIGFRGAQLTNARFNGVVLSECDFQDAIAEAAEFMGARFDRCLVEGVNWSDCAPGWMTTDNATRREMINLFLSANMALPFLPLDESFDLVRADACHFRSPSWQGVEAATLDAFAPIAERLGGGSLYDGFVLGVDAREPDSETWTYACRELGLSVVAQLRRGSSEEAAENLTLRWDATMRAMTRLFELRQAAADESRLLIEYSEPHGVARWRWNREGDERIAVWNGDPSDLAGFFRAATVEAQKL
ncbi:MULTISPECIES: pentapeptide repeat-containing protein [unclassified Microbacterium]|uniref:pentapeptide repeat-containing protein n=1 Tax=unclassified Microbacterium TaxID=2609290 RepID=UPI00214B0EF1|nr:MULTISPECIES: pentapeptide repeat-containing protein [unclassified Microbacterium]MCR2784138.1 pentapeptide repeat-containing protein [Microbacterium sp. zg.B96]WIM15026.1 pentapeptide repeat-containing protein [Microbacterium sp. zg-B96]